MSRLDRELLSLLRLSIYHVSILILFSLTLRGNTTAALTTSQAATPRFVDFREATPQDVSLARTTMFRKAMNPLSIKQETLLVAYDKENEENSVCGFGQIRPLDDAFSELASLFVFPSYRGQGVGSALVTQLLQRHDQSNVKPLRTVCLLTLRPTSRFFAKFGFQIVDDDKVAPKASDSEWRLSDLSCTIQLEYTAGSAISLLLGNDIVCMVRPNGGTSMSSV